MGSLLWGVNRVHQENRVRLQRLRQVVLDPSWQDKRAQHTGYHGIQSLQEQECEFGNNISTAAGPLILFRYHLVKLIKQWHAAGDRIILFMDHNKHVIIGLLGKALADKEGLDLWEAIVQHTGTSPGTTFFQGSKPIDGLRISSNLNISNACVMPFGLGIGDHCTYILVIQIKSLVRVDPVKIVQPASRRLNSRLPGSSKLYIDSLEANIIHHCLLVRFYDMHTRTLSDEEQTRRVIIIDEEGNAYMQQAEKICRKIKCCRIPFSPDAALWIRHVQV
jgi:hypothetical protein